ncbi:MAG: DUF459 domain-containing protein [Pseudomonadota bacterium]
MGALVVFYALKIRGLVFLKALKLVFVLTIAASLIPFEDSALPGVSHIVGSTPALAQEKKENFLQLLLRGGSAQSKNRKTTKTKRAPVKKRIVRKKSTSKSKSVRKKKSNIKRTSAPTPQNNAIVEKAENAQRILVVGDFIADGMSQGLTDAFSEVANIVVDVKTNGSSGLVRDDFYNWPQEVVPMIEALQPAFVVAMLGSNDRQAMRVNGRTVEVRSEAWQTEYISRVESFAKAVRGTNTRLIWVGSPPFRFSSMSADILAFNQYYKAAVESTDGYFVDIWDGFVDAEGNFITSGADINGQQVRLRSSDGINFTKAGKRKLAFYVEQQLKQLLGDAASPLLTSLGDDNVPLLQLPPLQTEAELERTNPISIQDPDLDGGNVLLGDVTQQASAPASNPLQAKSVRQRLVEEGLPPPSQPDRADNFTWPG